MADPIRQPNTSTPAAFMQRALDLAAEAEKSGRGNAYGAVIVQEDKIIGDNYKFLVFLYSIDHPDIYPLCHH